ncbi:hypothetical protein Slin15195_G111450 [Septoria linicola]|uniref:Uncharacterized protein n=1 Tax=Septoria linicola TaxID=215465 RepID=A0A9Q9ENH9_9PEZI|nr:hypothetical protein Slin15195_G111450 [Septoria linicola]
MQYSSILLSALAATGTLAAPARRQVSTQVIDNSIRVGLQSLIREIGSGTTFNENHLPQPSGPTGSRGPYDTVSLSLGADILNPALRCQILDTAQNPIVVVRGENVDITFADGGNGPWTFRDGENEVSQIICDPAFVKGVAPPPINADQDLTVRIQLSDGNLARQIEFDEAGLVRESKHSPDSVSVFNSVSLTVGEDVENQGLRCQILDAQHDPITLKRGENVDTTFADGGNGAWSFLEPGESQVSQIVCNPAFVKASA